MQALVQALLAALPALLQEMPELIAAFENIVSGAKANQTSGSLAAQVTADTQAEADNLGKL